MDRDPLIAHLRRAWRATLLRYETDRVAGRETDDLRDLAGRFLALLNDKPSRGPDVVADMKLRMALSAVITAELATLDEGDEK